MENLVQRYIELWNARDAERRAALLKEIFTEDATYVDPLMQAEGRDGIDGLVQAVQTRFPDARFTAVGNVDPVSDHLRFSWALGPTDGPPIVGGTDFGRVVVGRFASIVGFLNPVSTA